MNTSKAAQKRRESAIKYDAANMAYQTIKIRKSVLEEFKAICKQRGDRVNTVLREAIEDYIAAHRDESQTDLSSLNSTIKARSPSKLVVSLTEAPDQPSELKWWERSIPSKYRGQFATYSEFTDYIRANDLLSELETDLDS